MAGGSEQPGGLDGAQPVGRPENVAVRDRRGDPVGANLDSIFGLKSV